MPEITGHNPLTLAEDFARAHVASSAVFQKLTNAADADAAAKHVFIDAPHDPDTGEEYLGDELVALAPFVIVSTLGENSLVYDPIGTESYDLGGVVTVELWLSVAGKTDAEALRAAKNAIGSLLSDMATAGDRPGHLAWPTMRLVSIVRVDSDERTEIGDFAICACELAWGSLRAGGSD